MDIHDIGPIRLMLVTLDGYLRPLRAWPEMTTDHGDIIAPAIVLMSVHRIGTPLQSRYVVIPFLRVGETHEPTPAEIRCDVENGLNTLLYLFEHPEITRL